MVFTPPAAAGAWTQDARGAKADPVTVYVHGPHDDVKPALAQGGWTEADPRSLGANVRHLGAAAKQEALQAMTSVANHLDALEMGIAGVFGFKAPPLFHAKAPYTPGVYKVPVSPQTLGGLPMLTALDRDSDPLGGRHHLRLFDTGERDAQGSPGASSKGFGTPWGGGSTYGEFVGDSEGVEVTLPARTPLTASPFGPNPIG